MTLTLLVLAAIAAANPLRAVAAAPRADAVGPAVVATAATAAAVVIAAALSDPALDALGVTVPSARIAAGFALVAVGLKDTFATPPGPEPGLAGWRAGLVPLMFPVVFSPALALLAIAGAADRGVSATVGAVVPALAVVALGILVAPRVHGNRHVAFLRATLSVSGIAAAGLGVLVILDGVYDI